MRQIRKALDKLSFCAGHDQAMREIQKRNGPTRVTRSRILEYGRHDRTPFSVEKRVAMSAVACCLAA